MARTRVNRLVRGEHLVINSDGDKRHSDQVTIGLYGAQKGKIVDIDDLDGPDAETMLRVSRENLREPRPLKWPITGPEREQ